MNTKWISIAILWLINQYPFGNATINSKIKAFATALPKINPTNEQIAGARKYIANLGLAYSNPWLDTLNESVDFLQSPYDFNRNTFIGGLSRASKLSILFKAGADLEVRATLERLLPK